MGHEGEAVRRLLDEAGRIGAGAEPLARARWLARAAALADAGGEGAVALQAAAGLPPGADLAEAALASVAAGVATATSPAPQVRGAGILLDQAVWVTAPARVDFAGGWTDTPPICQERGGAVLNAAVRLNGLDPIQVVAKLTERREILLTSMDLGEQVAFREAGALLRKADLGDWSSLARMALRVSGFLPDAGDSRSGLEHLFGALGGGLHLTVFSGLPRGSGLGTSSILGAAVLACLARVAGEELSPAGLIARTSLLEQRMTSGGGWQDQAGGIVGGVKLIRSEPGLVQVPRIHWTVFGGSEHHAEDLSSRCLLYFTGIRRRAANILQKVVLGYLQGDERTVAAVEQLGGNAFAAKAALETGDLDAFAAEVRRYASLKEQIDAGSFPPVLQTLLSRVQEHALAVCPCGAGGGGFVLIIARDQQAAGQIRRSLADDPLHTQGRFFDFSISPRGLSVHVL